MGKVAVIGAFDTKGKEFRYLADEIEGFGVSVMMIDVGILREPDFQPDIMASEVAKAGNTTLKELRESDDRKKANDSMVIGIKKIVAELYKKGIITGAVSMGGGQGTHVASAAMSVLPIGFPKVILSTVATVGHAQSHFEGINDTMVMNSLVDIQGLNYVMKTVLEETAATIAGLVKRKQKSRDGNAGPRIAMSMFGITTPCVSHCQSVLESKGYEVLAFHTTGMGGRTMEKIIGDGIVQGVADITLGEITSDVFRMPGGAGEERLLTAGRKRIPQIVVPGALDVLNFMPPDTMPEAYKGRLSIMHNRDLKVVRTNVEENKILGKVIAKRLNQSLGKTAVILPLRGISENDKEGNPFYSPEADKALFDTLKKELSDAVEVIELDMHINDHGFAEYLAMHIMELMEECR